MMYPRSEPQIFAALDTICDQVICRSSTDHMSDRRQDVRYHFKLYALEEERLHTLWTVASQH